MGQVNNLAMFLTIMLLIFLISLTLPGTIGLDYDCPDASIFLSLKVNETTENRIIIENDIAHLKEDSHISLLDVNEKEIKVVRSYNKKKRNLPVVHDVCLNKIPKELCINEICVSSDIGFGEEACAIFSMLRGCPVTKGKFTRGCVKNMTLIYNSKSNQLLPLNCRLDSKAVKYWDDYGEITHCEVVGSDPNSLISYILFAYRQGDRIISAVCPYKHNDISASFSDEGTPKVVLKRSGFSNYEWVPYQQNDNIGSSIRLIRKPLTTTFKKALINFEFENEKVEHYQISQFQALANKTFVIHIFVTNKGRVIKGITKDDIGHHFDLWCKVPGKIKQVEVLRNRWILLLTDTMLIALPIQRCNSINYCPTCIEQRDPHCAIQDVKQKPCVNILDVPKENHTFLRQDFEHGNAVKMCNQNSHDLGYNTLVQTIKECNQQIAEQDAENKKLDSRVKELESLLQQSRQTVFMHKSHFYEDLFFWAFLVALLAIILLTIYIVKLHKIAYHFAKKIDIVGYTRKKLIFLHDPLKTTANKKKNDKVDESKPILPDPNEPKPRQKRADIPELDKEIKNDQVEHAKETSSERMEEPLKTIDDYLQNITSQKEKESSSGNDEATQVTSL